MALNKKKKSEIPEDAVILSEDKALIYHGRILENWPHPSDIFAYKYGRWFLVGATTICGMFANNLFRTKFRLRHYGQFSSYLPISLAPAGLSLLLHNEFVTKRLILRDFDCAICMQSRAAALQTLTGCVIPFVIAPIMSLSLVHRYHTVDIPYISKEPMKLLKVVGNHFVRKKNVIFGIFLFQALMGNIVTYFEADSIFKVDKKLMEYEKLAG